MIKVHFLRRKFTNYLMLGLCGLCALLVLIPLGLILFYTVKQGFQYLTPSFFVEMPKPVGEEGGGMANAIMGTLILLGVGSAIALPAGILAGMYLSEFGRGVLGTTVRFLTDVLSGIPSIVVGVVAYTLVVQPMKHFSALAGGVALAILMLPTIIRTTDEMMKLVPQSYREAGLALGIPQWKTTIRIVYRTALKGIVTGILLAIGRAAGETAPMLFTALGNRFWSTSLNQPIASLTVFIYEYAKSPFEDWNHQAWTAALVLIALIFTLSLVLRLVVSNSDTES